MIINYFSSIRKLLITIALASYMFTPDANAKTAPEEQVTTDPAFRSFTLAAMLRLDLGGSIEYLFARHHSIRAGIGIVPSMKLKTFVPKEDQDFFNNARLSMFGAGLGYRWYSGSRGANGFYAGPVLDFGKLSLTKFIFTPEGAKQSYDLRDISLTIWSPGLDIGYQFMTDNGFTLGIGLTFKKLFLKGKIETKDSNLQKQLKNEFDNDKKDQYSILKRDLLNSEKGSLWTFYPHFTFGFSF